MKNIKPLLHKVLGSKSFILKIPKEGVSNASMRKYKQIYMTHLTMAKCAPSIKLAEILDIDTMTSVRVQDQNRNFVPINMSLCSILVKVTVSSSGKPLLFLVIAETVDG